MFDPATIRPDFPVLATKVDGRPLVYLDNAATSHSPRNGLDASHRDHRSLALPPGLSGSAHTGPWFANGECGGLQWG